ncbi:molybdenum-binding protein [Arcobacter sp. CECT 8983]|uniref:TOBE domain-containing protein n=1 Tax=Arcobacter sp. CECT 8983 TaxID=2044508 RepID=UPI00100B1AB5|nr:TOBE domain-containing protein [Arcobacter sp. CECT 8983]RXJ91193.1 molybdenum-binding protein [Arcobacter sp. CECT 8983]
MEISSNLTLELLDQPFLLEKRIELLFAIQKCGSISKAAKEVPMSYKKAWEAVDAMNNLSSQAVVLTEKGGKGGGGTSLTSYGENLLKTYLFLKEEQKSFLNRLKEATDIDTGTLKTIGRLAMQISARNQIVGRVDKIVSNDVSANVVIVPKSGHELFANISNDAMQSLDIKKDSEVIAIFKSINVLLSTSGDIAISARNKIEGTISSIIKDKTNSEVIINIGEGQSISSIVTTGAVKQLGLEEDKKVYAYIKANDIMIGK